MEQHRGKCPSQRTEIADQPVRCKLSVSHSESPAVSSLAYLSFLHIKLAPGMMWVALILGEPQNAGGVPFGFPSTPPQTRERAKKKNTHRHTALTKRQEGLQKNLGPRLTFRGRHPNLEIRKTRTWKMAELLLPPRVSF